MPHDITLISTIAVAFVFAFGFGYLANRLSLPPLVGYLLGGVVIGRFAPGQIADGAIAGQLADIGVMLLMFGVGLHFSVTDLKAVRWIAVPGAIAQILIATMIGTFLAMTWGWSLGAGVVLGLSLSVASTVVLLKALEENNGVATPNGRIAIGWLIVEDLAMVLTLVLLPAFAGMLGGHVPAGDHGAGEASLLMSLLNTAVKVAAFALILLFFGPKLLPWLLRQVARTGSRELFTLSVLAVALGIAFGAAELFDVSFALGAFFAGVVLNGSDLSHKAAANSLPLQDAFAVLFFVSVGMLFDPAVLWHEPGKVLAVLALVLLGKSFVALGIVLILGYPLSSALMVAASLSQVGEFSFILAGLGISYGLMPPAGLSLVLAGAILSIALNPLVFALSGRLTNWVRDTPRWKQIFEDRRNRRFALLQGELEAARREQEAKAAAHRTLSPEELVSHFPLFAGLTPEQRETLILHFHPVTATPGQRLIRAGDKADTAYFVSSGEVEVTVLGRKVRLGAGAFFGEMALLTGERRSADVTALDFAKFLSINQADFRRFLRKYPEVRAHIAAQAAQRGEMNRQWLDEDSRAPYAVMD